MKKGYVNTDNGQIHFRQDGSKGPLLFLFHETALSSRIFERTLPLLAAQCQVIAFDTPGYGKSDPPNGPISLREYAERLATAMVSFGDAECTVAGVHTGAAIAVALITEFPGSRIVRAVLSGVPLFSPKEIDHFQNIIREPVIREDGQHLSEEWRGRRRLWGGDSDLDLLQLGFVEQMEVYRRCHWGHDAVFAYDIGSALPRVECPVLLLNGERDSLATNDERASKILPRAWLKLIEGTGGQLAYRRPELFAQEILSFMELSEATDCKGDPPETIAQFPETPNPAGRPKLRQRFLASNAAS